MEAHCCERMVADLSQTCDYHPDRYDCPDALVAYSPRFREYGLIVHDDSHSHITIAYCPWCGTSFPPPPRNEWFERLDRLGLEPDSPLIPTPMLSDEWWRSEQ